MIYFFLIYSLAIAAANEIPVPRNAEECKSVRTDPKKPGHMPRGVTTENIKEYSDYESRCALSIRENQTYRTRCKETFKSLKDHAIRLNEFVTKWCDNYFNPATHSDIAPKEKCTSAIQKYITKKTQTPPTQADCPKEALAMMKKIDLEMHTFKKSLEEFKSSLEKMQKENFKTVQESFNSGTRKAATDLGAPSAGEKDALALVSNPAKMGVAMALYSKISSSQGKSDRYIGVNSANYQKKFEPISNGWKDLHSLDKRSVFREQSRAYLNTEEVLLATETYLAEITTTLDAGNEMQKQINQNITNLGPLAQVGAGLVPALMNNGTDSSDRSDSSKEIQVADSLSRVNPAFNGDGNQNTRDNAPTRDSASVPENNINGLFPRGGKNFSVSSSTAASKSPNLSARESLKKRLEATNGVSKAKNSNGNDGEEEMIKDETSTLPPDGSIPAAFGNLQEQGMMHTVGSGPSFGASSSNAEFTMEGAKTDDAVRAMLQEFNAANSDEVQGDYIGDSEGSSLFLRVKDFHERCLKKGCVLQLAHRKI